MISMIVLAIVLYDNNTYANTAFPMSVLAVGVDITLISAIILLLG